MSERVKALPSQRNCRPSGLILGVGGQVVGHDHVGVVVAAVEEQTDQSAISPGLLRSGADGRKIEGERSGGASDGHRGAALEELTAGKGGSHSALTSARGSRVKTSRTAWPA